jgi:pseudoazurin
MATSVIIRSIAMAVLLAATATNGAARAADFEVRMLNQGPEHAMQFDPEFLRVAPGDTVRFVATDRGHSAESIDGMIPDGAEPFTGNMGQDLSVKLTVEGVYGFGCRPHGSMGMVGLIVVGHPTNEEAAKHAAEPGMARRMFARLFQALDARLASGD